MKRLNMICGPRNVSTALMYAFDSREDVDCLDEPFYAAYLSKSNKDHPGRDEIIASQNTSELSVVKEINSSNSEVMFIKNMAHHLLGEYDLRFMESWKNCFLIRDPLYLINSFVKVIPDPTIDDIGLKRSYELAMELIENNESIGVLDSKDLLLNPKRTLEKLCAYFEIPFSENMLSWNLGPKECDGVWAKFWYKNVHHSTRFKPFEEKSISLPPRFNPLIDEANYYFRFLKKHAII